MVIQRGVRIVTNYFAMNREDLEETYLTSCIVNNMDAILVMSCSSVEFIQKQMRTTAIPIIYLCAKGEGITSVTIPETQAAEVLGKYLMQKQHLMIRYLGSNVQLANLHMEGIKAVSYTHLCHARGRSNCPAVCTFWLW